MYKILRSLRRWLSIDAATPRRPETTCGMDPRQLADLPPHHPRCD
ncbi:hypothetical protein [Devosia sp.]